MNKPNNPIDSLFEEKLNGSEVENPSGAAAWEKMNALLQANNLSEKDDRKGGIVIWFRQYGLAVAAAVLVAMTGLAVVYKYQSSAVNSANIAIADSDSDEIGGNGKETVLSKGKANAATSENQSNSSVKSFDAKSLNIPNLGNTDSKNTNPTKEENLEKSQPAKAAKKQSLRKQYPDVARMPAYIAGNELRENTNSNNQVQSSLALTSPSDKEQVVESANTYSAVIPTELAKVIETVPVQIVYKGVVPTAAQLAEYKAEQRGEKVKVVKPTVKSFFASLWRLKKGEGNTNELKQTGKGLYAAFSTSEEE